jgi:PAS domain S-box-containing protein
MDQHKIDILQKSLITERAARKAAEKIVEDKSKDLHLLSNELKKTNLKLEAFKVEQSSQIEAVFENINDGYILMDIFGNILKMNNNAKDFFGYNIEEEKLNVYNLIYSDDLEYASKSFITLKKEGSFTNYRTRVLTKDKQIKWVQINGTLITDKENNAIGAQGIVRDITSEKRSKDLLTESENRLSSLISNLDSAVLLEDENRKIILTNTKFCEFFNISSAPDLLKGEDCAVFLNESKKLFKNPDKFISRVLLILHEKQQVLGDEITLLDGTILERDYITIREGNQYKGHLWTYKDITLKKQYGRSLEAQKQNYSNIIANMNLGLVELNTAEEILLSNESFSKLTGYSKEELIGKKGNEVLQLVEDFDRINIENSKRQKGESSSYEVKIKNKFGEIRDLLISGAPNYDVIGQFIGTIGVHLDITDAKRNAELIQEKKKELDTIVHNSAIGIVLTKRGRIIKTNAALQKMIGYSEAELNLRSINDLTFEQDSSSFKTYIRKMYTDKINNFGYPKRYKKKDGSVIWTKTNINIVRDNNNKVKYEVVFIENTTSNREKTIIIDLINNLTKVILDKTDLIDISWEIVNIIAAYLNSEDCVIYLVDESTKMIEQIAVYGNKLNDSNEISNKMFIPAGEGIVGSVVKSKKSELVNDTSKDDRYIVDDEMRFSEIVVPIISDGIVIGVIDSEHKNKNHFKEEHIKTLESIASLVAIKLRTAVSIRERKKVEIQNEKLLRRLKNSNDELNEYAHTVSHDLKTPLQSIEALVSWIKLDNKENLDKATLQNIALIESTVETMDQLIINILKYSEVGTLIREEVDVDLNLILKKLKTVMVTSENITINILSKLPKVKGDTTKFQQLFQNLISNAIKFNRGKKGIIEIDYIEKKSFHQFSVKDNGIGIAKKYHKQIFKIFESLNKSKDSSGIGLSIVKKIVDLYEGNIWLESKPNIGTTFYFTIKK